MWMFGFTNLLFALVIYDVGNTFVHSAIDNSMCRKISDKDSVVLNCSGILKGENYRGNQVHVGVTVLDMSLNQLTYVPSFITEGSLKDLRVLNMSGNQFTSLTIDGLISIIHDTSLVNLDLSENDVSQIPNRMETLEILKLNKNNLSVFAVNEIKGYLKLHELQLQENIIREIQSMCEETLNLVVSRLDLSGNGLTKIWRHSFCHLDTLTYLNLSHNSIDHIEKHSLSLTKLEKLDLSHNHIKTLPVDIFKKCSELSYLDLSYNQLLTLPSNVPMMERFDVSFNRIRSIPETLSSVLYPQTLFLIGGNPFLCNCDLLWLKELYDTRAYLLRYVRDLNRSKFIPVCAGPGKMEGMSWETINDESFECKVLAENDMKLTNEKIENVLGDQEDDVTADVIGPDFLELSFSVGHGTIDSASLIIQYHKFGEKRFKKEVILPASVSRFRLKGLEPSTPYIVCLFIDSDGSKTENTCIEVVTLPDDNFYLSLFIIYQNYVIISSVIVMFVIVFVTSRMLARGNPKPELKKE